jgi:hypothetical protein
MPSGGVGSPNTGQKMQRQATNALNEHFKIFESVARDAESEGGANG